ncbi:MAG TPA: NADP-dependent malic enzyme [Thauera aminoaromatica]|jgi:malate dehydrogenase (oxaloacetate-decarboxylating)(NADP+)|uniref:Bifunctional malic enzyme oxidoreductase/phosphotransacetylase n=2 Tax=Thauera aminoaromatica TaxID=164330 RepID=N6XMH4_THASP|nr:NADP-dependent malic enzyme [Thauera aminoaromatica]TMW74307.1 NADP-dependent malic enzyme [Thauera sp. UPWRP]ACK54338.1 Malate dehydrogenase (oxaloacetate-decarboxylating) (NADP(+))., Phosphate acetyltransferase [Thauera aminoaromatica]ENO82876.1 bifunctional malic enzyme oxidoreductase/phosphotransacetylase [Thauera aminoaromatica S2]MCK6400145.1 NADP-dependent malic enzyme [Thauera aminoaromatica]HMZ29273.1 NADP-dependent malic enzyme [Thauera aminoaromatica]
MDQDFITAALDYHRSPTRGKISVVPTKGLTNQRDLALAYSPGVAAACDAIVADPAEAFELTSRGNLVAVVTNGTAVLGLGNIGPLASKPVMEGKGCLFKKFANIDVFDIELAENDPDKLIEIIAALEPTLGGINLEDIKAPECFYIEKKLRERMKIPVFHDDQHGTAIISAAGLVNGLKVVGKNIADVKLVCSGAGAAAIACLDMMVSVGLRRENIYVCDSKGVIYEGREPNMEPTKARYAQKTEGRALGDVIAGADVFLGLSTAGVLKPEMVAKMAAKPLIFALANPNPEILPADAKAVRPDCIVATGRSDFPNQVNNVLCFPFIFRGALDVGATTINEEMKLACVKAIAELAEAEASDIVASAYGGQELSFGSEYIIPKPFDPRLIVKIAPAVAKAAMDSGVATKPIADLEAYASSLNAFVYQSGIVMKPVFSAAKAVPLEQKRVIYAEGEDERVLHAVRVVLDEGLARPILIGRPEVIEMRIKKIGLNLKPERDFEIVNPESDPRYRELWTEYYKLMKRDGVTPDLAKAKIRRDTTLIGVMMLRRGDADALVCGTFGSYDYHLKQVADVIGLAPGAKQFAAMNLLLLTKRMLAITDTYVNENPSAEEVAEIARMASDELRRFGIEPSVALLSHSNFGSSNSASARKMRRACEILRETSPDLNVDGEMHGDAALSEEIRDKLHPDSGLKGEANLLVMPNLDAANISFNLMKVANGDGVSVGPILLGAAKPVHIVTPSATVRRLVNMTALAVVDAKESRNAGA